MERIIKTMLGGVRFKLNWRRMTSEQDLAN